MRNLDEIMQEWNKDAGCIVAKHGGDIEEMPRIPFTSPTANYMTYGGIPRGKMIEFFGGEGSGKTTTALNIAANAQDIFCNEFIDIKENLEKQIEEAKTPKAKAKLETELENLRIKKVVYLDLENTLDLEWGSKLGVIINQMIIIRPQADTAEQVLQKIIDLISTEEVGLLILDSIPYLVPQQIYDESLEKKMFGGASIALTAFCSKVAPHMTRTNCTVLMLNQIREDLNNPYNDATTPGGKALKHAYTVRIRFKKGALLDENNKEIPNRSGNPIGNIVNMEIVKTKAFKPNRRLGSYTLNYFEGIDYINDLILVGMHFGYIIQGGAWYTLVNPSTGEILQEDGTGKELKFQGLNNLKIFLQDHDIIKEDLLKSVNEDLENPHKF